MIARSSRLTLRCWDLLDAAAAFRFYGDPEVSRLVGDGKALTDIAHTEKVLAKFIDHHAKFGFCPWAVIDNQTEKIIGICGLHTFNETQEIELGFRILRSEWGKGVATEASHLAVAYAYVHLNSTHIAALTDVENRATQNILSRIGFSLSGEPVHDKHGRLLLRYELRR